MNKFVTSALALSAAGSLAYAGPSDSEWLELDREIASLASPVTSMQGGITWSALLRTNLHYSDDDIATGGGTAKDLSGWEFQDIDLAAAGQVGDWGWRIGGDIGSGSFILEDAYVTFECGEMVTALMGNHKAQFLRSNSVSPEGLLFTNRTALGSVFDGWDNGVAAWGSFEEMINWSVSIQNGANGASADHAYFVRLSYALGEGAADAEGALGAGDEFAAELGVAYANLDDVSGTGGDDTIYALDFWGTAGPIGFGAEVVSVDDGIGGFTDEDFGVGSVFPFVVFDPDSTPFDVTGSFLVSEDLEVGVRYEDTDNSVETTILTLGASWYMMGHNAKWQFSVSDIDSDSPAPDGTIWQIGVVAGASGS